MQCHLLRRCPSSYYLFIEDVLLSNILLQGGLVGRAHVSSITLLSWFAELINYHGANQVILKLNHVKKTTAVPFARLDSLVKTYRMLASGAIPGACHVDKLEVRCL